MSPTGRVPNVGGVDSFTRIQVPVPLVIVEGFLGGAGPLLWGDFESRWDLDMKLDNESPRRQVIFVR